MKLEINRKLHCGFAYSFLPKWMLQIREASIEFIEEIEKTKAVLGKKETEDLVIKFRDEAYQQTGVNSKYIINKLRSVRITNKS